MKTVDMGTKKRDPYKPGPRSYQMDAEALQQLEVLRSATGWKKNAILSEAVRRLFLDWKAGKIKATKGFVSKSE
jgi:hypothetical protein